MLLIITRLLVFGCSLGWLVGWRLSLGRSLLEQTVKGGCKAELHKSATADCVGARRQLIVSNVVFNVFGIKQLLHIQAHSVVELFSFVIRKPFKKVF